jgi:general stress protein 26
MMQIFKQKKDCPLPFIQQKINELQTALFSAISNTVLKIPSHVITATETDAEGRIWFAVPKPLQSVEEFDKEFPAKLDFFRKGMEFYLKVEGKASIMSSSDELKNAVHIIEKLKEKLNFKQILIIQVQIQKADYFEANPSSNPGSIRNGMAQFYNWFFQPVKEGHRQLQPVRIPLQENAR